MFTLVSGATKAARWGFVRSRAHSHTLSRATSNGECSATLTHFSPALPPPATSPPPAIPFFPTGRPACFCLESVSCRARRLQRETTPDGRGARPSVRPSVALVVCRRSVQMSLLVVRPAGVVRACWVIRRLSVWRSSYLPLPLPSPLLLPRLPSRLY